MLIFLFFCSSKRIATTDMEASLPKGSLGWFWKLPPQPGQIILITNPLDDKQQRLLRIIATEGQRISFQNGSFLVDGVLLAQTDMGINNGTHQIFKETMWMENKEQSWLLNVPIETMNWNMPEMIIPDGEIFVACDNRSSCLDSRWWGSISTTKIQSTLWLHLTKPDHLHSFFNFTLQYQNDLGYTNSRHVNRFK